MPLLTIFSAPKPFTNPHIATIQRNAIRSWIELGDAVEIILLGDEPGIAECAAALGVCHLPHVRRNASGTPLVSSMFDLARRHGAGGLLCAINTDVILLPDILAAARAVQAQAARFLIVGQRYDLSVTEDLDFSTGWQERLIARCRAAGRLHPRGGSDYFIFPRDTFVHMPDFAIGRAGWDNWMIFDARWHGAAVVDATADVRIIHQDHDYSHLPGGQSHYRLPETYENIHLAGGKRAIFDLADTNRRLVGGRLQSPLGGGKKFWREIEIFPLVRLHSWPLGRLFFALFHPYKAYAELRAGMKKKAV